MTETNYLSTALPVRPLHRIPPLGQETTNGNSHRLSGPQKNSMTVGPGIRFKGEISNCATLIVEGNVHAKVDGDALEINQRGVFCGTAKVLSASIHGRFEGDLIVSGLVRIANGASVVGSLRYGQLNIAEGAEVAGEIGKYADGEKNASEETLLRWPTRSTEHRPSDANGL